VTAADTGTIPVMRPWLGAEEAEAAAAAVASGWVAQGPRVAEFERRVAERVGAPDGVAVSSCTAGLHLALVALDVGPGDEVVVPSLSFIATANVVRYVGASPVFADVDVATGNLTAETVERVLTPRTRAVVVVHQGGVPADVDAIGALCGPRGVEIVEDAACAIGAELGGRPIGSHSDLVVFSFHPRKVITTGEGGMVMARSPQHAARIRRLREHGMSVSAADRHASQRVVLEQYLEVGFNYRMTEIQAAVGLVQLGRLDAVVERRRSLAARYTTPGRPPGRPPRPTTHPRAANFQSMWVLLPGDFPMPPRRTAPVPARPGVSAGGGSWRRTSNPRYAGAPHDGLRSRSASPRQPHPAPLPRDDRHRPRPRGRGPPRGRGGHRAVTPAPLLLVGSGGFRTRGGGGGEGRASDPAAGPLQVVGFLDDDPSRHGTESTACPSWVSARRCSTIPGPACSSAPAARPIYGSRRRSWSASASIRIAGRRSSHPAASLGPSTRWAPGRSCWPRRGHGVGARRRARRRDAGRDPHPRRRRGSVRHLRIRGPARGGVTVEAGAYVGAAAAVRERLTIGAGFPRGDGIGRDAATCLRARVWAGVPARRLRAAAADGRTGRHVTATAEGEPPRPGGWTDDGPMKVVVNPPLARRRR